MFNTISCQSLEREEADDPAEVNALRMKVSACESKYNELERDAITCRVELQKTRALRR